MDVSEPSEALTVALCLAFKLTRSEGHTLGQLLVHGYATKEVLVASESALIGRQVTENTVQTIVCMLRKKLTPRGIIIATIPRLGYALDQDARHKIRTVLARHDAPNRASRPQPKPTDPNMNPTTP